MTTVQIVLALLQLTREIVKLIQETEEKRREIPTRIRIFSARLKRARETGDTSEIERMFADDSPDTHVVPDAEKEQVGTQDIHGSPEESSDSSADG